MRRTSAFPPVIGLVLVLVSPPVRAQRSRVTNGGFEELEGGRLEAWQYACEPDQIRPRAVAGVWQRATCQVMNLPDEDFVYFYFYVDRGSTGSVWIDNVTTSPELPLNNLSFEEGEVDGTIVGWWHDRQGTVFLDATRSSEGQRSLRITHHDGTSPITRIRQKIPLEPGREYSVSFDYFVGADFVGTSKGYVFDRASSLTRQKNPNDTQVVVPRAQCGKHVCVLSPAKDKPVDLYQRVAVPPDTNLEASIEANNPKLDGDIALTVADAASGRVLGQSSLSDSKRKWRLLRTPFQSRSSEVVLRVVARGEGEVEIDNVMTTPPQPVPPLQRVEWSPATQNFRLPAALRVSVDGPVGPVLERGLGMLAGDLAATFGVAMQNAKSGPAHLTIALGGKHALRDKGDESYSLEIAERGIAIRARGEPGAFYGLMTVLQLLTKREGVPLALACRAEDYPDMPMRGVLYGDAEQAARWKMNTLMVSTGYPAGPEKKAEFGKLVSDWRSLNLDVIPYFLSLGGGYHVQKKNPNLAVGVWVRSEKLTLNGVEPVALANPFVIRTELTDVELTSADGKTRYRTGQDYEVNDGDMSYPYTGDGAKPFAVARTPGSAIPDGATVLASYDHVSHYRESTNRTETHIPYCPLEPEVRRLMGDFMRSLAKDFPVLCINPSHCLEEFRPSAALIETDSRCLKSGKSPIELLVEDVCFLDRAAKAGRSDVRILQWAGHVNDYTKAVAAKLPKDALINIWGYDPLWPVIAGRTSVAYWSKLGFTTSVMPWYDLTNVRAWAQVVAEAKAKGYRCLGMIGSCWNAGPDPSGGMEETAIVSWRIPPKGDRRFIELPPPAARMGSGPRYP